MDENQKEIDQVSEEAMAISPEEIIEESQITETEIPEEAAETQAPLEEAAEETGEEAFEETGEELPALDHTVVFKPLAEPDYDAMCAAMTQPVQPRQKAPSSFDGTGWQVFGLWLAGFLLTVITLGIAYPWVLCMHYRWETKHTVINGKRLSFDGRGSELVGKWVLWVLLSILTLGLYSFRARAKLRSWRYSHTRVAGTRRQNLNPVRPWKVILAVLAALLVLAMIAGLLWAVLSKGDLLKNLKLPDWLSWKSTSQATITEPVVTTQPTVTTVPPTTTEPTVPTVTTEPPTQPPTQPPQPVYRYRVTARGGLRMRSEPSVNASVAAMIPYNTLLTPINWEGNWAQVEYNGKYGWCSGDYLKLDEEASITEEELVPEGSYLIGQVNAAKEAANNIIRSYKGKTPVSGRVTLEVKDAEAFYEEAAEVYSHWLWFAGQFDEQVDMLKVYGSQEHHDPFFQVEDDRFKTVEDLCDYYYSLFTDDLAASMLMNNVLVLDGKLYARGVRSEVEGVYDSHWYDVSERDGEIFVTLHVKERRTNAAGQETVTQWDRTHRCFQEDGVWVFESVCMIYT